MTKRPIPTPELDLGGLLDMEAALDAEALSRAGGIFATLFPDCVISCDPTSSDPLKHKNPDGTRRYCRKLYPKHTEFFGHGNDYRERLFLAGNRVGKTIVGAYECACHFTGQYPPWWTGRRFRRPVRIWVAGDTSTTVRDITQEILLGPMGQFGTGMIPDHLLGHHRMKRGISNAVDMAWIRHTSGGNSICQFKSYDQRRESFQGTQQDAIWLDEEPPRDIYAECLLRTTATGLWAGGILLLTFTPLSGLTDLVESFIGGGTSVEEELEPEPAGPHIGPRQVPSGILRRKESAL